MAATTITRTLTLEVHTCGNCGITWGLPDGYLEDRQADGKTFWCPNGCGRVYRTTTAQRLERDLKRAQQERDQAWRAFDAERTSLRSERASHRATRGHLTRARKRAAKGVCPVDGCQRSFANVARHVATQHPDYQPGTVEGGR